MRNFTLTTFLLILTFQLNGQTIYVNGSLPTNGDGTSWASAFNNLQSAIEASVNTNEIWVAKGTYYPSKDKTGNANPADNRTKTFFIDKNIKIYGGFLGTETSISQRNIDISPTVLTGDLGVVGDISDNSYFIMFISGENTNIDEITLDGLKFQFGNKTGNLFYSGLYGGSLMIYSFAYPMVSNFFNISNCTFSGNIGNGISISTYGLNSVISNCVFENNTKSGIENNSGGGVDQNIIIKNSIFIKNTEAISNSIWTSAMGLFEKILDCVFIENNIAIQNGLSDGGTLNCDVINCTFLKNYNTSSKGTAIRSSGFVHQYPTFSNTYVKNCVFQDAVESNQEIYGTAFDESSGQVADWGVGISINNCLKSSPTPQPIQWGELYIFETNTLYSQPLFLNYLNPIGLDNKWGTADDGLQLSACSPAINAGDNTLVPAEITEDLIGNNRIQQSNVDIGAYESSTINSPIISNVNASNESYQVASTFYMNDCNSLIAKVEGNNSANSISGPTTAKVWIEPNKIEHNSLPIVTRHYEITPTINPTTSTGRITLYFTQQEFDTYNNDPSSILDLPTDPNDAIGKGILRVKKISGISSDGTGLPSSYSGPEVELNPVDSDIVWNQDKGRWEVSFDVTGFSGFFVQGATVLPLNLINFDAFIKNTRIQITWQTAKETNFSHFEIQRSGDAQKFVNIGTVKGSNESDYKFLDEKPLIGINYYRLKMIDLDSKFTYSKIVAVNLENKNEISISPNPTAGKANLNLADKTHLLNTFATLSNSTGQTVKQFKINKLTEEIDLGLLPKAVYLIRFEDGTSLKVLKE